MSTLPQSHVRVDVAFYDEAERAKLLAYSTGQTIEALVGAPIDVPMAEFLAYYLFHRKRLGSEGFRDSAAIGRKLGAALAHLDGCVTFNGHSIRTADGVGHQLTEVSEHIGESIGLSVVSRIHGLNEADWAPIPEQRGRTAQPSFDFELSVPSPVDGPRDIALPESVRGLERAVEDDTASDGNSLVQVENKGSSAIDNREHSPAVVAQKRKIDKKKAKLRSANVTASTIRYGTIAVVDPRHEGNVRCWLTDPPGDETSAEPRRDKLLHRLQFIREWVTFVSPRSQLASALATRIADLAALSDPFELDGVPLIRGSGEPFITDSGLASWSFWLNKSAVGEGSGGVVVQLTKDALMFLGIRRELLALAIDQAFPAILKYEYEAKTSADGLVKCVFSDSRFKSLQLPSSLAAFRNRQAGYSSFVLPGSVHYSHSGLVIAVLPLPVD